MKYTWEDIDKFRFRDWDKPFPKDSCRLTKLEEIIECENVVKAANRIEVAQERLLGWLNSLEEEYEMLEILHVDFSIRGACPPQQKNLHVGLNVVMVPSKIDEILIDLCRIGE